MEVGLWGLLVIRSGRQSPRALIGLENLLLPPCENTAKSWPASDTKSVGTLILDFMGSRTVRNTFLCYKPHSLWYFGYSNMNGLRPELPSLFWGPTVFYSPLYSSSNGRVIGLLICLLQPLSSLGKS